MVKEKVGLRGRFQVEHYAENGKLIDIYDVLNDVTDEGLNYILDVMFNSGSQITTWYMGLIDDTSFTAVANTDTMASHSGWIENQSYTAGTRPQWDPGNAAAGVITNGTTVDFAINATETLRGIFITSNSTKGGSTGTLWNTALFQLPVDVANGQTLKLTYTLTQGRN